MKIVRYAVVLLIASAAIRPAQGQSTNSQFIKFAKAYLVPRTDVIGTLTKPTNEMSTFAETGLRLSADNKRPPLRLDGVPPFAEVPPDLLIKKENASELNFVEDAIDRGEMVTGIFRGGRDRGRDSFTLRMKELGPRSHLDWFVDNTYPAHAGNIGKDEWVVGFKFTITPKPNKKWRSR